MKGILVKARRHQVLQLLVNCWSIRRDLHLEQLEGGKRELRSRKIQPDAPELER
jgi:hypothetical protein